MKINNNKLKILNEMQNEYKKRDINYLINSIMEIEKKDKEKISNEWINDRWYELKTKSRTELEYLLIKYRIPDIDDLSSDEIRTMNNLSDVYCLIKDSLFKGIEDSEIDVHKFSEYFIEILNKQNEKIDERLEKLIHEARNVNNTKLFEILEYVVNIRQFYSGENKETCAILCHVSNIKELHCYKADTIPYKDKKVLEKYNTEDRFEDVNKMFFDKRGMKLLFEINLCEYIDWNEVIKKAINSIEKKFPEGTIVMIEKINNKEEDK